MEKELGIVFDEVRLLWNTLVQTGEQIHGRDAVSMGERAVLEFLVRNGPSTVPHIARSRRVSRQFIQTLVNALRERGLAKTLPNEAHKRSHLIALTAKGERKIESMRAREARELPVSDLKLSKRELERVAESLRQIRGALER